MVRMLHPRMLMPRYQPKEKPLRTKRGHRKPPYLTNNEGLPGGSFNQQGGPITLSPSGSDAVSHHDQPPPLARLPGLQTSNGLSATHSATPPPPKPKSAFEVFSNEVREQMYREGVPEPERLLAQQWQAMGHAQKEEYERKLDGIRKEGSDDLVVEDVEMGDGDDGAGDDDRLL